MCVLCEANKLYFYNIKISHLAIFVIVVWQIIFHMKLYRCGKFHRSCFGYKAACYTTESLA